MRKILIFLILVLLVGCSHFKSKAKDFMKARKWLEARHMWDMHLKKDPVDEEALAGRDRAEFEATNEILVRVRNKREAGDVEGAIADAKFIHTLHKKWNRTMERNFSTFQKGEIRKLLSGYLGLLNASIEENKPLRANYLYLHYSMLFNSLDHKGKLKKIPVKYNKLGRKLCYQNLSKGMAYPFYRLLVRAICKHFDVSKINNVIENSSINHDLSSVLKTNVSIASLNSNQHGLFENKLNLAFIKSPWYLADGNKPFRATVTGAYYFESKTWVDAHQEEWKDKKGKKHSRTIYKKMLQEITRINSSTALNVEGSTSNHPFSKKKKRSIQVYRGGKYPGPNDGYGERAIDSSKWIIGQTSEFYTEILSSFNQLYSKNYCQFNKERASKENFGNQLIRCARYKSNRAKAEINFWFKKNFSVSYGQLEQVIGQIN
jgi:hypothetical protein